MSFVSVMRLQKRQKAPTNTKSDEELLAPFPTIPPILDPSSINNNPSLENTVVTNGDDGVSDTEMFGLIGGALVVIGLIGIFIKKKIGSDRKKLSDKERSAGYKSHSSQNLIDDLNEQGKNSPIMIEYQHQFNSTSPRTYDSPLTPRSDSNDSHFGPPYVKKNLSHSKQDDLFYSPDSYRGPSLDDDSSHLIHAPNFQQKDLSYPSDSYNRSSPDGYSSPYLPKSPNIPNTPNTPNTPHTPHTPPYPHDDYPSPYLPQSPPFAHNIPNTPNTPLYSPPNSYGGSQNSQSYRTSQHFQQQYFIEPTQGTLLPPKSSYQPQQYNSSPHSPHSLEDSPRSLSFSKSEPVSTNDQNSSSLMSYQDTPQVPTVVNNIIGNDNSENFSVNSDVTNNEIKEIDDMIANIIQSENIRSSLPKISRISDSSFAGLLSDIVPITLTNEKSNRPDSQTSSIYSVQPIKGISKIEIASENKIPSSNLNHDHDLPQSAAMGYIEPTQSNMVIEHVNEPSSTSEVQLDKTQPITTPITTGFIQPSQSNMKIEKVDSAFRPEISASTMTGVETQTGPKPLYDIYGIKKHAEKILNTKAEKKSDLNNESNPEKVTENNETQNNEKNDGKQGEPLVRKKSVRFRTESNEEEIKVSNTKKSILINKNESSTSKSGDSKDEKENRDSNSGTYDFDISGYQDESYLT